MTVARLLLVDDAREMAVIVGHLAARAGCTVEARTDVASALEFLQVATHAPQPMQAAASNASSAKS